MSTENLVNFLDGCSVPVSLYRNGKDLFLSILFKDQDEIDGDYLIQNFHVALKGYDHCEPVYRIHLVRSISQNHVLCDADYTVYNNGPGELPFTNSEMYSLLRDFFNYEYDDSLDIKEPEIN
jgi:hypothetical protein